MVVAEAVALAVSANLAVAEGKLGAQMTRQTAGSSAGSAFTSFAVMLPASNS